MILAHWNYTRKEWEAFIRWNKRRKGLFYYIIHRIFSKNDKPAPEITITPDRVWIGYGYEHFSSEDHQLRRIDIREEGEMNMMEITYEWFDPQNPGLREIWIPIPRGKLREAIDVQAKLIQGS